MSETAEELLKKQINNVAGTIEQYKIQIGELYVKTFDVDVDLLTRPSEIIPIFEEFKNTMPKLVSCLKQAEAQLKSLEELESKIEVQNYKD